MSAENCPYCGEAYDTEVYELIDCPNCGNTKCTRFCIAGRGVACFECEEGDDEDL
jgi:hypothetical protein